MEPHPIRFVDNAHVLMSNGWVARGAPCVLSVYSPPPELGCAPLTPRSLPSTNALRSVHGNDLDDSAKKLLQEAAGDRIKLTL